MKIKKFTVDQISDMIWRAMFYNGRRINQDIVPVLMRNFEIDQDQARQYVKDWASINGFEIEMVETLKVREN